MSIKLSNKIRKLRTSRGVSQNFVAGKLGVSQRAYSKIECGQTKLNWDKLNQIADILEIGVWELIDLEKDIQSTEKKVIDPEVNVHLLNTLIHQYEERIKSLKAEIKHIKDQVNKIDVE